jgi:hypothetical protein
MKEVRQLNVLWPAISAIRPVRTRLEGMKTWRSHPVFTAWDNDKGGGCTHFSLILVLN